MVVYELTAFTLILACIPVWVLTRNHLGLWRRIFTAFAWSWGVWWGVPWYFPGYTVRWLWLLLLFILTGYAVFTINIRELLNEC